MAGGRLTSWLPWVRAGQGSRWGAPTRSHGGGEAGGPLPPVGEMMSADKKRSTATSSHPSMLN